jgi:protein-S-isoprenylcysteine O-methyltransferase Ste14
MTPRLARLRVPLGFAGAMAALWFAAPTRTTLAAGTLIAVAGEGVRVWAAGHLNKSREVTASGPYRFVAHPLYVGSSIMGAGLAVAANSILVAALVALYLATTITAAVRSEEAFLRARFGDGYDRYRRGATAGGARPFSVAQAIANREYRAVGGLVAAVLLLLWKATYNGSF